MASALYLTADIPIRLRHGGSQPPFGLDSFRQGQQQPQQTLGTLQRGLGADMLRNVMQENTGGLDPMLRRVLSSRQQSTRPVSVRGPAVS